MKKHLLALLAGTCVVAAPSFAQTLPGATQAGAPAAGAAQTGATTPGTQIPGGLDTTPAADPTAPSALGLGAVLRDAQTAHPAQSGNADRGADGANRASGAKARTKARAQGH